MGCLVAAHACAQLTDAGTRDTASGPVAGSMEVAAHLWAVIGRYRFAATADRVRVTLVQPDGRSDMHSLEIRCVPGTNGLARLEISDLTIEARGGVLRAVHGRDPTTYVQQPLPLPESDTDKRADPATVLRDALPPLPIPHLSLAFDAAEVDWCPLVTGLVWENAERLTHDGREGVRLVGRTDMGSASLEISGARIKRFEADLEPAGQTRIVVDCEPLEPSDPDSWVLDVSRRRPEPGLASLRPLGQPPAIGSDFPAIDLRSAGASPPPVMPARESAALWAASTLHVVLFLRDEPDDAAITLAASTLAEAYTQTQRSLLRGRLDGLYNKRLRLAGMSGAIEVTTDDQVFDRLQAMEQAWHDAVVAYRDRSSAPPPVGWYVNDTRLLDRLAMAAQAAVVVLDDAGVLRGVIPVDTSTPADLLAEMLLETVTGL